MFRESSRKRDSALRGSIAVLIVAALSLISAPREAAAAVAGSWQPVTAGCPIPPGLPLLLTDGTVMVHRANSSDWWKLTPDLSGDYVHGTWKQIASLPIGYGPWAYASAVLADGRVFVMGGEYNFGVLVMTNKGAIYDPTLDVWTPLAAPPGWPTVGDASSMMLPDGRVISAGSNSGKPEQTTVEIYSPPYLFQGARPTVTSAPMVR